MNGFSWPRKGPGQPGATARSDGLCGQPGALPGIGGPGCCAGSWPVPQAGPRHRWRIRWLAGWVGRLPPAGLILDIGCGYGALAGQLASAGRVVLAMDIDRCRVNHARRTAQVAGLAERIAFLVADGAALPLRSDSIPLAIVAEVLEHMAGDQAAFAEVERVMEPGGYLLLTVPSGAHRYGALDRVAGHVRRYDRDQLEDRLRSGGLEIELLRGWGFPLGRLYERIVMRPILSSGGHSWRARVARRLSVGPLAAMLDRLFELESHLAAGQLGAGWLVVARKPVRRQKA